MSLCVEKLPHSCGSSDGLQVFHDEKHGYTGFCFSCDVYVPNPYPDGEPDAPAHKAKTPEDVLAELEEIGTYPTVPLPSRHLNQTALEWFNVKMAVSEQDGATPVVRYFPLTRDGEIIGYKAKMMAEKAMWSVGNIRGAKDLFGWQQALDSGGKKLFITEGEDDAVALFQALYQRSAGTQWEHLRPAVVSLVNGAQSAGQEIGDNFKKITGNFTEIILCFDMDEHGRQAVRDVQAIIPNARTADLPEKDANECVMKGKSQSLANAVLFKSHAPKNTRVVTGSSVYAEGRKQAEWGLSYPWEGVTRLTRGMRFGETYYFGAGVKMGKSTVRGALATHMIREHGLKVFMATPEEANRKTAQLMAGQVAGKIFHDPEIDFDYDAYDKATQLLGDNLLMLNLYQHLDWTTLRADILTAVNQGAKVIFVDPITNLTNGISSGEANTHLQEISQDLAAMALDHQLIVWMYCHLKAPDSGASHERGGKVLSHQFAGSRAMMRSCHMMVGFEGNKDPDIDIKQRNERRFVLLEDREFGASGVVPLFYEPTTGVYEEIYR